MNLNRAQAWTRIDCLKRATQQFAFLLLSLSFARECLAERGYVLLQVEDARSHPIRGIEIGIEGRGDSGMTGDDGKVRLAVGAAAVPGDSISLVVLHSPARQDFVLVSPWDTRAIVPSFEDKPQNFIKIIVVQRGDRAALENSSVLASLAARINTANAQKQNALASMQTNNAAGLPANEAQSSLVEVAKKYGLEPADIDKALRALGTKTSDPFDAGQIALYERNYPIASAQFDVSLHEREATLKTTEEQVEQEKLRVAEAASFLAQSLLQQFKCKEAKQAVEKGLEVLPNSPQLLNNQGVIEEGYCHERLWRGRTFVPEGNFCKRACPG